MADNKFHAGVGEETTRNTEQTTVGHLPILNPAAFKYEPDDVDRVEWFGQDVNLGTRECDRMSQKWSGDIEMKLHTEAGTVPKIIGTLLKHFFGKANSGQNAATGQYYHMLYPKTDMFAAANLGDKALTVMTAMNAGAVYTSYPFLGGRVQSLGLELEPGSPIKLTTGMFGTKPGTIQENSETVAMPAANLRCDFSDAKFYYGTITKTGDAPNWTDIECEVGVATQFSPRKASLKFENGIKDVVLINGTDYAGKTDMGKFKGTLSFDIEWADPASGFSSYDEFKAWVDGAGNTNFAIDIDTGTVAGTLGDNHSLLIDLPKCQRKFKAMPIYAHDADPIITLEYEFFYDETAKYAFGFLLKNTADAL